MRSLALVFLCFWLALSGTAAAMPMTGTVMESTASAMAMDQDCPDMVAGSTMSSVHKGVVPDHGTKPDCCQGGSCKCAMAHVTIVTRSPRMLSQLVSVTTTVVAIDSSDYSSPALARLVRPPIS